MRILQGKEIDYVKTGLRWNIPSRLRKHIKQLPHFLLYNYPKKMNAYKKIKQLNKTISTPEERLPLNAYFSPSPMNELCDYVCSWEKHRILWDKSVTDPTCLITDNSLSANDKAVIKIIKKGMRDFLADFKKLIAAEQAQKTYYTQTTEMLVDSYKHMFREQLSELSENEIANYVITLSYKHPSISKSFAWMGYGDYILRNLRNNSPSHKRTVIHCIDPHSASDERLDNCYEYLGKYYKMTNDSEEEGEHDKQETI